MSRVFDVIGTTVYLGVEEEPLQDELFENDTAEVVLKSAFIDMDYQIDYCDLQVWENSKAEVDWILTIKADSGRQVKELLDKSAEVGKQYSYIYEIHDVTDEVSGHWKE